MPCSNLVSVATFTPKTQERNNVHVHSTHCFFLLQSFNTQRWHMEVNFQLLTGKETSYHLHEKLWLELVLLVGPIALLK